MHEVGLEVAAAPIPAPAAEDGADRGLGGRVRDVEDVVLLAALVPAELAVEGHGRERPAGRTITHDPVGMIAIEPAAVADEKGRNPQARNETRRANLVEHRLHPAWEL